MKYLRAYYPWPDFPSVSISGTACVKNCLHCDGKYLSFMKDVSSIEKFLTTSEEFHRNGAKGLLVSGGCFKNGKMINLPKMLPAIKKVIDEYGFIIKLHTGLVDDSIAEKIVSAGVQIASMEMISSDNIARNIYNLDFSSEEYVNTFRALEKARIPHICPHIVMGLPDKSGYEKSAISLLSRETEIRNAIDTISMVVFRPTPATPLQESKMPDGNYVYDVISFAKEMLPEKKIILAALRPRPSENIFDKSASQDIEIKAVSAGIDGIEVPSKRTIKHLSENNYGLINVYSFGVLPVNLEHRVRVKKGFL